MSSSLLTCDKNKFTLLWAEKQPNLEASNTHNYYHDQVIYRSLEN